MNRLEWKQKFGRLAMIGTMATALVACGGGGGGGGSSVSNGVTQGVIQGFGSICVNGVKYDDSSAEKRLDDSATLKLGMKVTIKGEVDDNSVGGTCSDGATYDHTGTASIVAYDDELEGPIDIGSINLIAGTFTVFGLTIQTIEGETQYANVSGLDALKEGDFVEISGMPGDGIIVATFIEKEDDNEAEVKGTIANGTLTATTFTLSLGTGLALDVNYSGATELDTLSDGAYVEVEGSWNGSVLAATKVELEDDFLDDFSSSGDYFKVEGLTSNVVVTTDVNGVPQSITFDLQTFKIIATDARFEDGTALDLVDKVWVEVKGTVAEDGVTVNAHEVEFHDARIEIDAQVDSNNGDTITLLGIMVGEDATTEMEDENGQSIDMSSIAAADYVEVRGRYDEATNKVIATRIRIEDRAADVSNPDIALEGPVDSHDANGVTIAGRTAQFAADTKFEIDEIDVGKAKFLEILAATVNPRVEVEGSWDGATFTAQKVELDD